MPSFDADYYSRFYRNPSTRVVTPADIKQLGNFVFAYLGHLRQRVTRVLDIGCGLGWWQPVVELHAPRARYVGVEVSEYLCNEYGWTHASVVDYSPRSPFDLVICQGVMQYLPAREARAAIENLGKLCRGTLYLEALTTEDWEQNCDQERTDGAVHLRTAAWYRRQLQADFINCGGGVFATRSSYPAMFELEKLD